jgi:glycosyltransferase involved in cell wall biosynthesis
MPANEITSRSEDLKVLILCSGVGHAMRGFETFAVDSFEALRHEPGLRLILVKGRGASRGDDRSARTPGRDSAIARLLGRAARRDGYFAEQMLYGLRVLPMLRREDPAVIYLSDWALAGALGRWRRLTGQRFRILLCNGAPGTPYFDWAPDRIQHLTPAYYDWLMGHGESEQRHVLLPLGGTIPPVLEPLDAGRNRELRARLGLPQSRPIVLSVAALNMWSKRLDYVIREVARLEPRPYLVMLGQQEEETPELLRIANATLGRDGFAARTVTPEEVHDYYRAASVFVLGSEYEASPRVLVESLSRGMPTIAHDSPSIRFVGGEVALLRDLGEEGALASALRDVLERPDTEELRRSRHAAVFERFSWERLRPRYVAMFNECSRLPLEAAARRRRV